MTRIVAIARPILRRVALLLIIRRWVRRVAVPGLIVDVGCARLHLRVGALQGCRGRHRSRIATARCLVCARREQPQIESVFWAQRRKVKLAQKTLGLFVARSRRSGRVVVMLGRGLLGRRAAAARARARSACRAVFFGLAATLLSLARRLGPGARVFAA